jgi:hypothetical protein
MTIDTALCDGNYMPLVKNIFFPEEECMNARSTTITHTLQNTARYELHSSSSTNTHKAMPDNNDRSL